MTTLQKLTPNEDLQCYFNEPSAVAALSQTSPSGFTVSGSWRQQADWAVVEWNRDNVFEHPAFRNLPDGDLSGLQLSYDESRSNCIPVDSDLYATVDWPYLRVWADSGSGEQIYWVPLANYATPAAGGYTAATATFQLQGTPASGDYAELACQDEHYTYQFGSDVTYAAQSIAAAVNAGSLMTATSAGTQIALTWNDATAGANANSVGVYGNATGAETWSPASQLLSGGASPSQWHIALDFANLTGYLTADPGATDQLVAVPTNSVRKMRWTWAADLQPGDFVRSEFAVTISNWTVSGSNQAYSVAGPGSWRVEDGDKSLACTGQWTSAIGNYSGGSISWTVTRGDSVSYSYQCPLSHTLCLGTRLASDCTQVTVQVDQEPARTRDLLLADEDVLVRWPLGVLSANVTHTVTVSHSGAKGTYFYLDFLEIAIPTTTLPTLSTDPTTTLATDWDTLHSQALAPERTARMIQAMACIGRANHYSGALWFYELCQPEQVYASASITFSGTVQFGDTTQVSLGPTNLSHLNLIGDTPTSLATAFALLINDGSTGVWAAASGATITITARAMGTAGNGLAIAVDTGGSSTLQATVSGPLAGGVDGIWLTDLSATPRINRAARDWSQSFFTALQGYGIVATCSFSTELGNGDSSAAAGIAQRYPDGSPCMVNTPALQTNFSPTSLAFWQQVYLDMAAVMVAAGQQPYLQFGEVQWWYFCPPTDPANGNWTPIANGGMPFYDAYTTATFQSQYSRPMYVFTNPTNDPTPYPQESAFLPGLIGQFTAAIMAFVRQTYPNAQFEVLYPPDTNDAPLTQVINLPATWVPANLNCFKTENFTYTGNCNLDAAYNAMVLPILRGFSRTDCAHLVGIGNYTTPWKSEWRTTVGIGLGSAVLFALDQYCLIGYPLPLLLKDPARGCFMGA